MAKTANVAKLLPPQIHGASALRQVVLWGSYRG
jgi:hypothetical protein